MVLTLADPLQLFNKPPQHSEVKSLVLPQMEASCQVSSHVNACSTSQAILSPMFHPITCLSAPPVMATPPTFSPTEDRGKETSTTTPELPSSV